MTPTIAQIERLYTMSHHDRQCPGCGWPLMALYDERVACPRCGHPTTDADQIDRATARALRTEMGLIP